MAYRMILKGATHRNKRSEEMKEIYNNGIAHDFRLVDVAFDRFALQYL